MGIIPQHALPNVPMKRIHAHWTAGTYTPNEEYDRKAYHFLIAWDGEKAKLVLGRPTIDKNSGSLKDGYSAHTLNANTDSISVSIASMAGATEVPFNPGKYPMRLEQFQLMCQVFAELNVAYKIPVTRKTNLSHAEVQPTLGIAQRQKWDFTRLPWRDDIKSAINVGDYMRETIAAYMNGTGPIVVGDKPVVEIPMDDNPIPEGALVEITAATLNFRASPNGTILSELPRGVKLRVLERDGIWLNVETPMGYRGWVSKHFVVAVDGPPAVEPTKPDRNRQLIGDIRKLLDDYEASL